MQLKKWLINFVNFIILVLYENLTVIENLKFIAEIKGVTSKNM